MSGFIRNLTSWFNRWVLCACLLILIVACNASPTTSGREATGPIHVRILATHDFHGAIRPTQGNQSTDRPLGGIAGLKAALDQLEADCKCPTIRVDSGDQMQGTLESNINFGAAVVAAFNHLGLDAAAVGNHELDWGVDTLLTRQQEANYPWLAANVFQVSDGSRPTWAKPFTIVERGEIKIGVVGYAAVNTPQTLRPGITEPYEFRSGYAGIRNALDELWSEQPDFVVLVAHAGGQCVEGRCTGEVVELAKELPPGLVHLIAGGHVHAPGEGVVQAIPIIRAGSNGHAVGVVDLYRLANGTYTFEMTRHTVYSEEIGNSVELESILAAALAAADAVGKAPVTTLARPLAASPSGDRLLGNFISDAVRRSAAADFGLHNPGGVRADLPSGPVSYNDLYRVLPFGNEVIRLEVTGRQLRQLVNQVNARYYFSNLRISRTSDASSGSQAITVSFSDGTPIVDEQSYTLATNSFLADGGDGLAILQTLSREVVGISLLDAVVDQLRMLPAPVRLPL